MEDSLSTQQQLLLDGNAIPIICLGRHVSQAKTGGVSKFMQAASLCIITLSNLRSAVTHLTK